MSAHTRTTGATGQYLQRMLRDAGMTQAQLAEQVGVSRAMVTLVICGRCPAPPASMEVWGRALGLSAVDRHRLQVLAEWDQAGPSLRAEARRSIPWLATLTRTAAKDSS